MVFDMMKYLVLAFSIILSTLTTATALNATAIKDCPALTPRSSSPVDITDLRIDDIKIFGSLGDRYIYEEDVK
jgi:hypothetical protein